MKPTEFSIEIKGREITLDVVGFEQGLTLGQMERIEAEFGVTVAEVANLAPETFSASRLAALVFGLALPKIRDLEPDDVRSLNLATLGEALSAMGQIEEDEEVADAEDPPVAVADVAPPSDAAASTGGPVSTPPDSGSPGWGGSTT